MRLEWKGEKETERTSVWREGGRGDEVSGRGRREEGRKRVRAYLGMEDKLWTIHEMLIPDADEPIRIVYGCWVLVVRSDAEFGVLKKRKTRRKVSLVLLLLFLFDARFGRKGGLTFGDQSTAVTDLPFVHLSSSKEQTSLIFFPSSSSLRESKTRRVGQVSRFVSSLERNGKSETKRSQVQVRLTDSHRSQGYNP